MSQNGDARVLTQSLAEQALHVLAGDRVAVAVDSSFRYQNDVMAPSCVATCPDGLAHLVFPAWLSRVFGDQYPVCAGGQTSHQRQIAAVTSHDLHHEAALVAGSRAGDGVHRLDDAVQRRVRADGHIRAEHVVVDGSHQTDDGQMRMLRHDLFRKAALRLQLGQQALPLLAKQVRAGQTSVAADDHQRIDAAADQVERCFQPALAGTKRG